MRVGRVPSLKRYENLIASPQQGNDDEGWQNDEASNGVKDLTRENARFERAELFAKTVMLIRHRELSNQPSAPGRPYGPR